MLLREGDRVRFTGAVEIYNEELDLVGRLGTVVKLTQHGGNPQFFIEELNVRLDDRFELLDEWDNEVHFGNDVDRLVSALVVLERI